MVTSPLKRISHSRSPSKTSFDVSHTRQKSSDLRKSVKTDQQQQHAGPTHQQQQLKNRITSMDLAKQYESDRAKIIKFCFSKREPDGLFHESYITHVRIIEDSHHPSLRPPPNLNPAHKKARILMMGVKKTGRVRLHKGRENKDGSVQIGRTWDLDELTKMEKDVLVPTGFTFLLGKPYYWETSTPKEATVFNTSVINTYIKYTGKLPELVLWDLKALNIQVPKDVLSNGNGAVGRAPQAQKINSQPVPQLQPAHQPVAQPVHHQQSLPQQKPIPQQQPNSQKPLPQQQLRSYSNPKSERPLQIVPPNVSTLASQKKAVLSASASSLPDSRIAKTRQEDASSLRLVPASESTQGSYSTPMSYPETRSNFTVSSSLNPSDSSVSSKSQKVANDGLSSLKMNNTALSSNSNGTDPVNHLTGANLTDSEPRENQLRKEYTASSLQKSLASSVKDVNFNRSSVAYIDVEKETVSRDVSLNALMADEDDYDDEDDDGYDLANYYGEVTPEAEPIEATEPLDLRRKSTVETKAPSEDLDSRMARYAATQTSVSEESNEARFVEELFQNIDWSVTDDVSLLEKKLTRQLVVAGNESCKLLINIGNDKAELKRSLDLSLNECQKLNSLMAFFNVEMLSFKDEIDLINLKADAIGLINRKKLYREIASMR